MLRRSQPDSGESCIVVQSRPARSLVAKFRSVQVVACSTRISCCREGRSVRTRTRRGCMHANLWCLMSWHPKCIETIVAIIMSSTTYLRIQNLAWWAITWRTLNHKLSNLSRALARDNTIKVWHSWHTHCFAEKRQHKSCVASNIISNMLLPWCQTHDGNHCWAFHLLPAILLSLASSNSYSFHLLPAIVLLEASERPSSDSHYPSCSKFWSS